MGGERHEQRVGGNFGRISRLGGGRGATVRKNAKAMNSGSFLMAKPLLGRVRQGTLGTEELNIREYSHGQCRVFLRTPAFLAAYGAVSGPPVTMGGIRYVLSQWHHGDIAHLDAALLFFPADGAEGKPMSFRHFISAEWASFMAASARSNTSSGTSIKDIPS